jgi:hypothetical protein
MSFHIEDGGTYKNVVDPYVEVGGVYRKITDAWVEDGGIYKKFFTRSLGPQILSGLKPTAHTIVSSHNVLEWNSLQNWYDASDTTQGYVRMVGPGSAGALELTDFDMSALPDSAIIDGVEMVVKASSSLQFVEVGMYASLTPKPAGGTYSFWTDRTSAQTFTMGGPTADWGETLTPAFFKTPDFLLYLTFGNHGSPTTNLRVSDLYLNIHYH